MNKNPSEKTLNVVNDKGLGGKNISMVNLGCARNLVDAQVILGYLKRHGHHVVKMDDSDIAIVNTCGFIEEAKKEFRFVIFDSPPMLPITDATILASAMDGVVLVVRAERTTREGVQRSIELLGHIEANILGSVVTGVNIHDFYGYDDYYTAYVESQEKEEG